MGSYPVDKQQLKEKDSATSRAYPVMRTRRHIAQRRRPGQIGSAITEFAVVIPFLAIAFFGTVSLGIVLGRYVQVVQVCRDLAHMYADGVDFSQAGAQAIAIQLAQGTGMTVAGGNGVAIFSRVQQVYEADCTAAGYATCPNAGKIVFTQRLAIGNTALRTSSFGAPAPALLNGQGNISASVYLQNAAVETSNLAALYAAAGQPGGLAQGDSPWIVETYFTAPDISFLDFSYSPNLRSSASGGVYARFIF